MLYFCDEFVRAARSAPRGDARTAGAGGCVCAQLQELEQRLAWFTEQYRLAQQRRFGAARETNPHQLDLFAELLEQAQAAVPEPHRRGTLRTVGPRPRRNAEAQAVRPCHRIAARGRCP